MRSRNGNRPLPLAICPLILAAALGADEYIISYRAVTQNALLLNETLHVSRAMTHCRGESGAERVFETLPDESLRSTLLRHYDDFFALAEAEALHVRHYSDTSNPYYRSRTVVTLPPSCFTVDFNDGFVKITPLK